jgi:hypothetical protein
MYFDCYCNTRCLTRRAYHLHIKKHFNNNEKVRSNVCYLTQKSLEGFRKHFNRKHKKVLSRKHRNLNNNEKPQELFAINTEDGILHLKL